MPVGNHDIPRINNNGRDQRDLEIIQTFAFTMPNVPFVYYGDEIGMRQLGNKIAKEGCYGGRAGTLIPMQWDDSKNLGFSTAPFEKVYLPYDTAQSAPTVMAQQNDPASLLNFLKKLIALHKSELALSNYAAFVPVYAQKNKYPFVYMRLLDGEKILIVLNPSNKPVAADIKGELKGSRKLLMGSSPAWKVYDGRTIIQTEAKSFAIMKIK